VSMTFEVRCWKRTSNVQLGILIAHFADKRSEPDLLRELNQLKNKRLTVELFYSEVSDVHKALCNVIDRSDIYIIIYI